MSHLQKLGGKEIYSENLIAVMCHERLNLEIVQTTALSPFYQNLAVAVWINHNGCRRYL